ncbi:hypothetical protein [Microbulbifer epialgicus]|uniref:Auto-transporter adhesin head GIN domain-containing protein n=1 Tax=Microbulbifer epialgicus TaxID=393907 RepID=A0ABV4P3C4_9GAMM
MNRSYLSVLNLCTFMAWMLISSNMLAMSPELESSFFKYMNLRENAELFSIEKTDQMPPGQDIIYIDYVCDPNDESKPCILDLPGNYPSVEYVIEEGAYLQEVRLTGQTTVVTMGGGQVTSSIQIFNKSELYLLGGSIVSINGRDSSLVVLDGTQASIAHMYDSSTLFSTNNSPTRSLFSYENASIYMLGANYSEGEKIQVFSSGSSTINLYGERFIYILSTNGCVWSDNIAPEGEPGIYVNIQGQCLSVGMISGSQVFITSSATDNGKVRFFDVD